MNPMPDPVRVAAPAPRTDSDTIKPIETRYADHRFRSRLEARWAVFFDHLGIEWQYEPECYRVAGKGYLPDFWLPDLSLWVEVKGVLDEATVMHLVRAANPACGLPDGPHGEPWSARCGPARILILGPIPPTSSAGWVHTRLDYINGEVRRCDAGFTMYDDIAADVISIGDGVGVFDYQGDLLTGRSEASRRIMLSGKAEPILVAAAQVVKAYRAARMARFEHGESGAPELLDPTPVPKPRAPRRKKAVTKKAAEMPSLNQSLSLTEVADSEPSPYDGLVTMPPREARLFPTPAIPARRRV